jgi:hypothetical protein
VLEDYEAGLTAAGIESIDTDALGRAIARGMLAEQQAQAEAAARAAEWQELVAAASALDEPGADYSEVLGELMTALVQE